MISMLHNNIIELVLDIKFLLMDKILNHDGFLGRPGYNLSNMFAIYIVGVR
jgi:hypothetical protein